MELLVVEPGPPHAAVTLGSLFQQPTLSDMTMYEMNFSLLVEDMLGNIDQPKYRQIIVEVRGRVACWRALSLSP